MPAQSYLRCSIEDRCCFMSDIGEKGCLFDWLPAGDTWQIKPELEMSKDLGCATAVGSSNGLQKADGECSMNPIRNFSQLSAVSNASEGSALNFVYQRKRPVNSAAALPLACASPKTLSDAINFVYERKKHQKSTGTNLSSIVSANTSPNGACNSVVRPEKCTSPSEQKPRGPQETEATRVSSISDVVFNKDLPVTTPDTIDGSPFGNRGANSKDKISKTVELYSVDDSCSSSMMDMDAVLVPSKTENDDTDECSSSGGLATDAMRDDQSFSVKEFCVSVLKKHGMLNRSNPDEDAPSCSGSSGSRSCNACGRTGTASKMLICDECEEAFHLSCFNPRIRKIPSDDWYCQSCAKKKQNLLKERAGRKSSIFKGGKGSVASEGHSSPIELMLGDTDPYFSNVRVGKGFQAVVPEWSGPVTEDIDVFPEPMELDPSHVVNLPNLIHSKPRKSSFIGNWLQCRQVIVGLGNDVDGTICGKWRRAPLFEVQTDNWDCFRSVLWDPAHADCSVCQELETEEVLKQLKYIELLKPRLTAKRRRLEICNVTGADGAEVSIEDASVETV